MTNDALRRMLHAEPFVPFDIDLANGESVPVDHPEFVAQTPTGRTIGVGLADGSIKIVDLLLVVSLTPRAKGAKKRKPQQE